MKNHFDLAGRSFKGSVLSAILLFSSATLAQEGTDEAFSGGVGESASADADLKTTTASSSEDASASAAATEEATPDEASPDNEKPETVAPAEPSASASTGAKTYPTPPPLALEILPSTGYPNDPTVGIRGGSLRFVMAGQQWPYMPSYGPGQPRLRIAFSGSSWVDANMRMVRPGRSTFPDVMDVRMQGRLTLRVAPTYNFDNDWFAQSRIEFVAITEQQHEQGKYVDVDEAWVRVGRWKRFDATVGRTQGFEVYHFGMGMDINTQEREGARPSVGATVQQPYALTELWDRGINNGAIALHWYMPQWLRLELLGRMGIAGTGNDAGIRPSGILDFGIVKVKGGYERRQQWQSTSDSQQRTEAEGYAGSVHLVFDPWVELGGGVAHRLIDAYNNEGAAIATNSTNTTTFGGFLNVRPYFKNTMIGIGYHNTQWSNYNFEPPVGADPARPENQTHEQMFVAAQYQLWDVFFIKYVLAYSSVHIESRNDSNPADFGFTDKQISHRLRFMLLSESRAVGSTEGWQRRGDGSASRRLSLFVPVTPRLTPSEWPPPSLPPQPS